MTNNYYSCESLPCLVTLCDTVPLVVLFLPNPPHKVCSSPRTPRTLSLFTGIRRTKSAHNAVSWEEGWRTGVCVTGLGVDKSRTQGGREVEPADRGIQG